VSSIATRGKPADTKKTKEVFGVVSFVFAPILSKEGNSGLLFVGAEKLDTTITEGDEELITILANQIGQALENARLFEKTWQAHQDLENRVEERTRELSKALEEVRKLSQRKNDFVSNVSHELRTPLTSIKGYASILLSGKLGELPEEVHKRLAKINKHSDELVQFVNDLLDLSRIESGKVDLKLAPLNLKSVIDEVADLLAVQFKEKQIEFSLDCPEGLPEVMADYSQTKRVFINLINNSIKYTPQGKISVRLAKLDHEIQVDVQDTGCGMPESAMDKLFTEFYRVDSVMNQEIKGTGLGLALVKNIVSAHKGKIWVKSKVGSGTTFSFTLPLAY
jgi:signal transduction histidine kinase